MRNVRILWAIMQYDVILEIGEHASYQLCVSSGRTGGTFACYNPVIFTCVRLPVVNFVDIIHSLITTVCELRNFITFLNYNFMT